EGEPPRRRGFFIVDPLIGQHRQNRLGRPKKQVFLKTRCKAIRRASVALHRTTNDAHALAQVRGEPVPARQCQSKRNKNSQALDEEASLWRCSRRQPSLFAPSTSRRHRISNCCTMLAVK